MPYILKCLIAVTYLISLHCHMSYILKQRLPIDFQPPGQRAKKENIVILQNNMS